MILFDLQMFLGLAVGYAVMSRLMPTIKSNTNPSIV